MATERLEDLIEQLRTDSAARPAATLRRLRPVLKVFSTYSTTADRLPPPTLIPVCLFALPALFRRLLQLEPEQALVDPPAQAGLRLCLQLYLRGLLRLLGDCEAEIKHVVVQSMGQSMALALAFPALARKWVRALVSAWSGSGENLNLGLRCFVGVERGLRLGGEQFFMWGLRRAYVAFFERCGQVSWRTLQHLNFMANCFCELVKLNPPRAYYVLFGYVRSLALQLQSLNSLKGKFKSDLINKLYSQQTLQILKLLAQVVGRVTDEEISALAYPLAEVINSYEHISESPEYLPLKLHLVGLELQLMEQTGLYLPHALETILKVLRAGPLQKKQSKKAGVQGSIELGYKLSVVELKNTNFVNDLFQKAVYSLYWLHSLVTRTLAGPQIVNCVAKAISSIEFGYLGYRKQLKEAARLFKEDAEKIDRLRSKKHLALGDKAAQKFEVFLTSKITLKGRAKFTELHEEHENMVKAKVMAEHEDDNDEPEEEEQEEDEELDSGWEEASEGASEFNEDDAAQPQPEVDDQQLESVSYEGDPEDASQAAKEWSEHEWSSQELDN